MAAHRNLDGVEEGGVAHTKAQLLGACRTQTPNKATSIYSMFRGQRQWLLAKQLPAMPHTAASSRSKAAQVCAAGSAPRNSIAAATGLTIGQHCGQAVHAVGNLHQALGPVVHSVHGGDVGQQRLAEGEKRRRG